MNDLLDNPYSRRAIVVMREREYDSLKLENAAPELITDDEISVVIYDEDDLYKRDNIHPVIRELQSHDLFRPGKILVQNPFQLDSYRDQSSALEEFSLKKHELFTELCQLLGAKKIEIEQVNILDESDEIETNISAGKEISDVGVTAELDLSLKMKNKFSSRLDFNTEFSGGDPQIEEAHQFIKDHGLRSDDSFVNLVRLRSNTKNPLKERFVKLNISEEAKRNIDVALRVDAVKVFKANASVTRERNGTKGVQLTVRVIF